MTEGPLFSTNWHARRAEDLASRAMSASMAGWWRRGRRRDMLAAAQVHATLSAVSMVDTPQPGTTPDPSSIHPALRLPAPKGHRCPACSHTTVLHREAGCDVGECECPAPFGRVMPGDPEPTGRKP